MAPVWWVCTERGAALARRLAERLGGAVRPPARLAKPDEAGYGGLLPAVADVFSRHEAHVFVCATGSYNFV